MRVVMRRASGSGPNNLGPSFLELITRKLTGYAVILPQDTGAADRSRRALRDRASAVHPPDATMSGMRSWIDLDSSLGSVVRTVNVESS